MRACGDLDRQVVKEASEVIMFRRCEVETDLQIKRVNKKYISPILEKEAALLLEADRIMRKLVDFNSQHQSHEY
jgi:hypothetical protein